MLVQSRLSETVTKRTFSDLKYTDYMKSNCPDETKTIFEAETEKVIKNSDAFSLEIDRLYKIEIMSCETDETEKNI